jgi:hypothetical protein
MMGIGRVKYELRPGDRLAKAQITKIITIIEIPVRLTVAGHHVEMLETIARSS